MNHERWVDTLSLSRWIDETEEANPRGRRVGVDGCCDCTSPPCIPFKVWERVMCGSGNRMVASREAAGE